MRAPQFKVGKGRIEFKGKTINIPVSIRNKNDVEAFLKERGFRKTRGTDYLFEKTFIKPKTYDLLVEKILNSYVFNYTISFKWWNTKYSATPPKLAKTSFISRKEDIDLDLAAIEAAQEYLAQRTIPNSEDNIEIDDVTIINKTKIRRTDIKKIPMYGASLYYPKHGVSKPKQTGQCVYDILLKNYKSKAKSIEALEQFFNKDRKDGLTVTDVEKFCKTFNISMYAADLNKRFISTFVSSNKKLKAMIFIIANNHCYEVVDEKCRKRLVEKAKPALLKHKPQEKEEQYEYGNPPDNPKKAVYVLDADDFNDLYKKHLSANVVYPAKTVQHNIISIYYPSHAIMAVPHYKENAQIAKALNITYKCQTLPQLSREHAALVLKDKIKYSTPNVEIQKLMQSDSFKVGAYKRLVKKSENVKAIDIFKQYSTILMNGDFHYIDIDDSIHKYNGEDIEYGNYYYIKTEQSVYPFKNSCVVDYKVISEALQRNIISKEDIKYYFTTHYDKDMNHALKSMVKETYQKLGNKAKNIINCFIGSLNITKTKRNTMNVIVDNVADAGYYFYQSQGNAKIIELENHIMVQSYDDIKNVQTSKLIYHSIVQRANWQTYKLSQEISKVYPVVAIKTDCIFYDDRKRGKLQEINGTKIYSKAELKGRVPNGDIIYRYEKVSKLPEKNIEDNAIVTEFIYTEKDWKENPEHLADDNFYNYENILQYDRVFVLGFFGSGKSYMIRKIKEHGKFGVVSYTNTGALNINGQTAHSFFNLDITAEPNASYIHNLQANYDGIVIDEINQMPRSMFRILSQLNKSFKIYGFGDFRQEQPVEPGLKPLDYFNSQFFKSLFDYNLIQLKKQCRSDPQYANDVVRYHDEKDFNIIKHYFTRKNNEWDDINIVRTNALRKWINYEMMKMKAPLHSKIIPKGHPDGQDMFLYVGLPIISIHTKKSMDVLNNEIYEIESINPIKIKYRNLNKNLTLSKAFNLTEEELAKNFSPCYAMTTYKIEGATIDETHSIWEFENMPIKSRYTALSRTTNSNLIKIENTPDSFEQQMYDNYNLNPTKCRIYCITDTQHYYIGSTLKSIEARFDEHKKDAVNGSNTKFHKYMRKIGIDNFKVSLVKEFMAQDHSHRLTVERYHIDLQNNKLNTIYGTTE